MMLDQNTLKMYESSIQKTPDNNFFLRQEILQLHQFLWDSEVSLRGKYIAVEGTDGSGKSTQKDKASKYLQDKGISVYSSDEPKLGERKEFDTYTYSGLVRSILDKKLEIPSDLKNVTYGFFSLARAQQHFWDLLAPRLRVGQCCLYGRSVFSNFSYQENFDEILDREAAMTRIYRTKLFPDIVALIDVDPRIAMSRIRARGGEALYENLEKLTKTRENFLRLAKLNWKVIIPPDLVFDAGGDVRWIVIDGNKSAEEVHEQIKHAILEDLI